MSLKTIYERFLSSPNPSSLSESATLHYVTTLITHTQQGPIIRHLDSQDKNVVRKKSEKVISTVEGHSSIALEVDTTLEFISSGGAYLPGLDNFIVDRLATIPITHIVHFDKNEKISQIRLTWDQGSLLQQVEVIGTRGRNWPIRDGKDQIKLITSSTNSAAAAAPSGSAPRGRTEEHNEMPIRNPSPSKRFIKDPHTSLDVFEGPRDDENRRSTTAGSSVAPRESARPAPREYSEIFAAGHEDLAPSPNGSPSKAHQENVIAPKGAGARKFQGSRLFEDDQDFKEPKIYKTNPARYNHFELGDAEDDDAFQYKPRSKTEQKTAPAIGRQHKNASSHWDFDESATPEKAPQRVRDQDQVHFSLGDQSNQQSTPGNNNHGVKARKDAETHFDFLDDGTPVQRLPTQAKARKDAELHFEFRDDPTPAPRRIIARTKAAEGIYRNVLEDDDEDDAPLKNITNNAGRRKDFDSHWDVKEDSPSDRNGTKKPVGENRMKAVKSMGAEWDNYDQSPEATKKPTGAKARNPLQSSWGFGEDEEEPASKPTAARTGRSQREQSHWDF